MDRKEAIRILENPPMAFYEKMWQALQMAIESLSAEPTDLISRAEVLNRIKAFDSIPWGDKHGNAVKLVWSTDEVKMLVEKVPSAGRQTGEWIKQNEELKISDYRCSACGYYHDDKTNYCENCGAKMGGNK